METPQENYSIRHVKGAPIIGSLYRALFDPLNFMVDISQEGGDIVVFHAMGQKIIQLNHPDLMRHVLLKNHKNYRKSDVYIRFQPVIGMSLLTSHGEKWKRDRQKIQPLFNRAWVSDYHFEIASDVSEKYKQKWLKLTEHGSAEMNITAEMADITIEIILKAIFGKNIDDELVASLHHSYNVMGEYVKALRAFPKVDLRKLFLMPAYFRFKKELDNLNHHIYALLEKYKTTEQADKYNMLALLIEAQKADPENFSDADIRDQCGLMIFAGFESTSILMQWLWYLLDDHTQAADKLLKNITQHAPCTATHDSSTLIFDQVMAMDYLALTVKETLRLYPSFWVTGREAMQEDSIGGYKVKPGIFIMLPHFSIHRDQKYWNDANSFIPERFLPENEEKIMEGAYTPFSLGPRKCSGYTFAEMEAKTVMAKLFPLFKVVAINKVNNALDPTVSLKLRDPLRVNISRR